MRTELRKGSSEVWKVGETTRRVTATGACLALSALLAWTIGADENSFAWHAHTRSIAILIMLVAVTVTGYQLAVLGARWRVKVRRGAESETKMLASLFRVMAFVAAIIAVLHVTGALHQSWAAVAGFSGLLLGWSLQAPVSGLAAWALINLKRPFRIGDRVTLPSYGLTGDIMDIGMMYTELNQVGGTVGSEDIAGRSVLIPNAMLFHNIVINYTPQQTAAFVLDEVVVRVTYNSDWDLAEKVLVRAAEEVTGDIIQRTGVRPYVRAGMYDYGVHMYLRYMTLAKDRPRITYQITKQIVRDFQTSACLDFAMPYVFSHRTGMTMGARRQDPSKDADVRKIPIDRIRYMATRPDRPDRLAEIADLRDKIAQFGLLQPIVVQETGRDEYGIVAGELRFEACKDLGWLEVPCVVKPLKGTAPRKLGQ